VVAEEYARATGKTIDTAEAQKIFDAIQGEEFSVKAPRQNNIKMMLEIAVALGDSIVDMSWTIYQTSPNCTFVTSDNPFIVVPPVSADPMLEGTGPLSQGATNLIPLSNRTLLCARREGSSPLRFMRANRDFVRYSNRFVASASDRFLLARDEPLLRKLVKVTRADQWQNDFMPVVMSPDSSGQ
jgi:hypothetical protein